jgi:hypothetical protein
MIYPQGISVQLKRALDSFTHGTNKGLKERYEKSRRQNK